MKPDVRKLLCQLVKSRADSTAQRYSKEILKFFRWYESFNCQSVSQFSTAVMLCYLSKVYDDSGSYSSLVLVHSALKWFLSFFPEISDNPLDSSVCHNLLDAARRCKPPVKKKTPISPDIVKEIIQSFGGPSANLKDLRLVCICCLGFMGFFRYDELIHILPIHLSFESDFLKIFVPRAKNDVYREGNYVYIKRLGNEFCAVALLERYMHMAGIELNSDLPLFRSLRFMKSTNTYKLYGHHLSYTRCREIFKNCLRDLGYDPSLYGLHSLRSGGATAAVKHNHNLSERILKLHGRWKSDQAKDMYILEDVSKRLNISQNLGI